MRARYVIMKAEVGCRTKRRLALAQLQRMLVVTGKGLPRRRRAGRPSRPHPHPHRPTPTANYPTYVGLRRSLIKAHSERVSERCRGQVRPRGSTNAQKIGEHCSRDSNSRLRMHARFRKFYSLPEMLPNRT